MATRERGRQVFGAIVGVAVAVLVIGLVVAVVVAFQTTAQIRSTQLEGTPLGKKLQRSSEQIESCTTPGKPCYERGQKQTGSAISDINRISIIAAACADQPDQQSVEQIQSCVLKELGKQQPRKP